MRLDFLKASTQSLPRDTVLWQLLSLAIEIIWQCIEQTSEKLGSRLKSKSA